jgi:isopenicillin-N epimerase
MAMAATAEALLTTRRYGETVADLWPLERDMIFLNHGSYGAAPNAVLAAQAVWRDRLESQPCRFVSREAPAAIRAAAAELAAFLGVQAPDLGFVENTTCGINAILRSLRFASGDEILVTDHIYNAIRNTLKFVLEGTGAVVRVVEIGLPVPDSAFITERVTQALTDRTRMVLIDHVASVSAVVFPVAEIAARCRARGVPVLVDGAHGPGMLDLDITALGVDWYVGNCHKWLCAPKGAAFIWAARERQEGLHPTVISHDLGQGFAAEFDRIGTRDASAWLAVPAALAFHQELGGPALRARNHDLAVEFGEALAARLGTGTGAPPELFGSMATVRLPGTLPATRAAAEALKARLWEQHRIEIHAMPFAGTLWCRVAIQAYNSFEQCPPLGDALEEALASLA